MKPTRIAAAAPPRPRRALRSRLRQRATRRCPPDSVAVVDGTEVTKAELDALLARAKKTYVAQKRAFPKAGTAEYQSLQTQAVAFLVQRAEYNNRAEDLELKVTEKEVDDRIAQIKKQSFGGSQKKLDAQLKAQGYTSASLRADIKAQLVSEKIYRQGHEGRERVRRRDRRVLQEEQEPVLDSREP